MTSLGVVIVSWNSEASLQECLEAVRQQAEADEIVVVDNASSDASTWVAGAEPGVRVLALSQNLGFAGGANLGIASTTTDLVLVLNPDVTLAPGALARLRDRFCNDPRLGVCGPLLLNPDRSLQSAGVAVDVTAHPQAMKDEPFFVPGCALAARREVFEQVGFDESFFMFVEDLDFCWRAQLAGWRVAVEPAAQAVHVGGASLSGGYASDGGWETVPLRIYLRERNTIAALVTNAGWGWLASAIVLRAFLGIGEALTYLLMGRVSAAGACTRGLAAGLVRAPRLLGRRRSVQSTRVIRDSALAGRRQSLAKLQAVRRYGVPRFPKRSPRRLSDVGGKSNPRSYGGAS